VWSAQTAASFTVGGTITQYDNNGTAAALAEGTYDAHYFSVDCDDFEELVFPTSISVTPGPPAGNIATFKTATFGIDTTKPTISAPVLSAGIGNNTFAQNSSLTASFTCADPVSNGVASGIKYCGPGSTNFLGQNPVTVPAAPVPTATTGLQTYTVTAVDQAGNSSSPASVSYCVGYKITSLDNAGNVGFTAPVLNPGSAGGMPNINSASVSQAIPMQIAVADCNGKPVTNLALAPTGTVVLSASNVGVCALDVPDNSLSTAAAGNSGWQNMGGGVYQYNWKPLPPKGACLSFNLTLGDGIQHFAYFKFK
jgi:hypothetical protein